MTSSLSQLKMFKVKTKITKDAFKAQHSFWFISSRLRLVVVANRTVLKLSIKQFVSTNQAE